MAEHIRLQLAEEINFKLGNCLSTTMMMTLRANLSVDQLRMFCVELGSSDLFKYRIQVFLPTEVEK